MYARYFWLAGVTYCHGSFKLRRNNSKIEIRVFYNNTFGLIAVSRMLTSNQSYKS